MLWLFGTRDRHERPTPWLVYVGNLAIVASNAGPIFWPSSVATGALSRLAWPAAVFVGAMLVGFVEAIVRYEQPGRSLIDWRLAMLCAGLCRAAAELRGPAACDQPRRRLG